MKILDVEQGSPQWLDARLGIPTASQFHRIVTPKTLKKSSAADAYMAELLTEWLLGRSESEELSTPFIERGKEMEPAAVKRIEFDYDCIVERVGFVTTDDGKIGCSPDGFIGETRGVEIKTPQLKKLIDYAVNGVDKEHRLQIQGGLWLTSRESWLLYIYNPTFPCSEFEMARDEKAITALATFVPEFVERLESAKLRLLDLGFVPASERPKVTTFAAAEGISDVGFDAMSDAMEFEY